MASALVQLELFTLTRSYYMSKSSVIFESLKQEIDELAQQLNVPSVLIMRSLPEYMQVEASGGRLEDTYPIGAQGRKSAHPQGHKPLYCERVVDRDAPLYVRDSRLEHDWVGNEDEVEFGLSNYLGYPVHGPDGDVFGTVCVLDNQAREYTEHERGLLDALRQKVEALLLQRHERDQPELK